MALNWLWSEKCGEATAVNYDGEEYTLSLYTGNAFLIMLYEYEEDDKQMYNMWNFWVDKAHMKNCLGLNKKDGYTTNSYEGQIKKFRLNKAKCRHWKDIVPALAQAFDTIDIELFTEE